MTRLLGLAPALLAVVAIAQVAGAGPIGSPVQRDCVENAPRSGTDCAEVRGMSNSAYLALSPDGRNLYVTGRDSDSVAVFRRDAVTGRIIQLEGPDGCLSDNGSGHDPRCGTAAGLDRAVGVVVSRDGRHVYVAAGESDAVTTFARDPASGALRTLGCISDNGANHDPDCATGVGLDGASLLTVSPDGRHLYVASFESDSISTFARDPATGTLMELGCISDTGAGRDPDCAGALGLDRPSGLALSPDGANLYAVGAMSSSVVAFRRDATSGALTSLGCISGNNGYRQTPGCAQGNGIEFAQYVVVTPDGRHVYVSATDSHVLAGFARDPAGGGLTQLPPPSGCVTDIDYARSSCRIVRGLALPLGIAPTRDGRLLYVGAFGYGTLVGLARDPETGGLSQLGACVSGAGDTNCVAVKAMQRAGIVTLSPDERHLYVNAPGSNRVVVFGRSLEVSAARVTARKVGLGQTTFPLRLACPADADVGCFGQIRVTPQAPRLRRAIRFTARAFDTPRGGVGTVAISFVRTSTAVLPRRFVARVTVRTYEPAGSWRETVSAVELQQSAQSRRGRATRFRRLGG